MFKGGPHSVTPRSISGMPLVIAPGIGMRRSSSQGAFDIFYSAVPCVRSSELSFMMMKWFISGKETRVALRRKRRFTNVILE